MVLAEGGGTVTVQPQHLRQRCDALRTNASVAGKCGRQLHNGSRLRDVVITASEQRHPRRGTKGRGMKAVIAESLGSQFVEGRHPGRSAKCAGLPEANVVQQNDNDVGCSLWSLDRKSTRL